MGTMREINRRTIEGMQLILGDEKSPDAERIDRVEKMISLHEDKIDQLRQTPHFLRVTRTTTEFTLVKVKDIDSVSAQRYTQILFDEGRLEIDEKRWEVDNCSIETKPITVSNDDAAHTHATELN